MDKWKLGHVQLKLIFRVIFLIFFQGRGRYYLSGDIIFISIGAQMQKFCRVEYKIAEDEQLKKQEKLI
jgi:hypothetical protein